MEVPLALLADYANVTNDGKLNIMGIFNTIHAPSVPAVHPQMRLIMRFQSDPAERGQTKRIEIKLLNADGSVIMSFQSPLAIPEDSPLVGEFNEILELAGLRFETFGDYSFRILVNEDPKATVSFKVIQLPTQAE